MHATTLLAGVAVTFVVVPGPLVAGDFRDRDAAELAALAPLSPATTATRAYGDRPVAAPRVRTRVVRQVARVKEFPLGVAPCEPAQTAPGQYACRYHARRPDYKHGYAFTPAYLTSPQVPRFRADAHESLLPPAAAVFYGVNERLFGSW